MADFDPEHHFYDWDGNKITLEQWGALWEQSRVLAEDRTADGNRLKTMYHGFIDPCIDGTRLFGSAILIDELVMQIQLYDSKAEASAGHALHLKAIADGFHCHVCRAGENHEGD